jgi:hypothetical protein
LAAFQWAAAPAAFAKDLKVIWDKTIPGFGHVESVAYDPAEKVWPYRMQNGDILATDWASGSLFRWDRKDGIQKLATGFKGPADFCAVPNKEGLLVAVPDLVKGEIRLIQLGM